MIQQLSASSEADVQVHIGGGGRVYVAKMLHSVLHRYQATVPQSTSTDAPSSPTVGVAHSRVSTERTRAGVRELDAAEPLSLLFHVIPSLPCQPGEGGGKLWQKAESNPGHGGLDHPTPWLGSGLRGKRARRACGRRGSETPTTRPSEFSLLHHPSTALPSTLLHPLYYINQHTLEKTT